MLGVAYFDFNVLQSILYIELQFLFISNRSNSFTFIQLFIQITLLRIRTSVMPLLRIRTPVTSCCGHTTQLWMYYSVVDVLLSCGYTTQLCIYYSVVDILLIP